MEGKSQRRRNNLQRSLIRWTETLIILKSCAFTSEGLVELKYDRHSIKTNTVTQESLKSPRGHRTHIEQMSIYPTPLEQRPWLNQFCNSTGKFTVNCMYLYLWMQWRCAHMCRGCARMHTEMTQIHSCFRVGPNAEQSRAHCCGGMNTCSHSGVWCTQITYCIPYLIGWNAYNAGFQQKFEQQIQSEGRTVSTAHSAIQTKGLHSELTKPGNTPKHCCCPHKHKSS